MQVLLLLLSVTMVILFTLLVVATMRYQNKHHKRREGYAGCVRHVPPTRYNNPMNIAEHNTQESKPSYEITNEVRKGGRFAHKYMDFDTVHCVLHNSNSLY